MLRTAKMELLRVLLSERLSAVAQEIYRIVETTIIEYEEEMSSSKRAMDNHRRLLDVTHSYSEDSLQVFAVDFGASREPENTTEPAEFSPHVNSIHPDSPPATENDHESNQGTLIDVNDVNVKQEHDLESPLDIQEVKKPFKCPVCYSDFPSGETIMQHFKEHAEYKSLPDQCTHTSTHQSDKPYEENGKSVLVHKQKCFSESVVNTFPPNINSYDRNEVVQDSLQQLRIHQVQTVTDIAKDAAPVKHIKTEPVEIDCGASHSTKEHSVNHTKQRVPKMYHTESIRQRRSPGKSSEPIIQIEAGTVQKFYKCPSCARSFSLKKTMVRHLKIHREDKPYQCQLCGRNFCQRSDLVNHTRIHTGERPYQCPECHKCFTQKANLMVHMRKQRHKHSQSGTHKVCEVFSLVQRHGTKSSND